MIQIPLRARWPQSDSIARLLPSGDQPGLAWNPGPLVSWVTPLPSAFITWIWTARLRSLSKAIFCPSGDQSETNSNRRLEVSFRTSLPSGRAVKISKLSVFGTKRAKEISPSGPGKVAEEGVATSAITPAPATPITIAKRFLMSPFPGLAIRADPNSAAVPARA
jgi:hypothetical protein